MNIVKEGKLALVSFVNPHQEFILLDWAELSA